MRIGTVLTAVIIVALLIAVAFLSGVFGRPIADANKPEDAFGNQAIGYVDITASIPINWLGGHCSPGECSISMGTFRPTVTEHMTSPSGPASEGGEFPTQLSLSCIVSAQLTLESPSGLTVAQQESSQRNTVIGDTADLAWGHVYVFEEGWHTANFRLLSYGGAGCTDYDALDKPVQLEDTNFGFQFDGVTT